MKLHSGGHSVRVLMISLQFHPLVGGYERAAGRLSKALTEAGIPVVVAAERRDRAWPAVEGIDGYQVRRLFCCYRRHLHVVTSLISFAGFLLRQGRQFDVWHVHQYGPVAALAVVLGYFLRRPVVLKLTSSAAKGIERAIGRGVVGLILSFFHRRVSACIATTDETRADALRFGIPAQRIHLVPNGLNSREFRPASRKERDAARRMLGLSCDRLVLYVGRLSAEKNPLGLLDAWAAISTNAREGTLLVLVGDGPERDKVQVKAQELNLARSVHLAGHCSDVATWYRAADVYVIPSHREGLSNSMIEALASGLPVISTRVSGSSLLLESPAAGVVVDVGSVEKLTAAIEALITDESMRTRLGENARPLFESRFSLESLSKKMILLYDTLRDRKEKCGKTRGPASQSSLPGALRSP